jgi:hypothetical protein
MGVSDMGVSGITRASLGDFCFTGDIRCGSMAGSIETMSDAVLRAMQAGRLPSPCASQVSGYLRRVQAADSWDTLGGGEYTWLNRLWRALVKNDMYPPNECLMGSDGKGFNPNVPWRPDPNEPAPPGNSPPWGWIGAGAGVLGVAALYWFVIRAHHHTKRTKR